MELPASYCDSATTPSVSPGIYFCLHTDNVNNFHSIPPYQKENGFRSFFNNPLALNRAYARILRITFTLQICFNVYLATPYAF